MLNSEKDSVAIDSDFFDSFGNIGCLDKMLTSLEKLGSEVK